MKKLFLPILYLMLLPYFVDAQVNVTNWQHVLNSTSNSTEFVQQVATDADNNLYVLGSFNGTVDFDPGPLTFNLTAVGTNNVFVAKYTPRGEFVFAHSYGGATGEVQPRSIQVRSNEVFVTGRFSGSAINFNGQTLVSAGSFDLFIIRMALDGTITSRSRMGSTGEENAITLATDNAGNIYIGGSFSGTMNANVTGGTNNIVSLGNADAFLAKYNSSLVCQWAYNMGEINNDDIGALDVDAAGNVYAAANVAAGGSSGISPRFNAANGQLTSSSQSISSGQDIFLVKYLTNGQRVWVKRISSLGADYCRSLKLDHKGSMYVGGNFNNNFTFDAGVTIPAQGIDGFVGKYDTANCAYVYNQRYSGTGTDIVYALAPDTINNRLYVGGSFSLTADLPATPSLTSAGTTDMFISVCNANTGALIQNRRFGINSNDAFYSIALTRNAQNIYVAGEQTGGGSDAFIARLSQCAEPGGNILGKNSYCNTLPLTYTIGSVAGATSYTWTLPAGWTGTSTTNQITVTPTTTGGTLSVIANTACGQSIPLSLTINYTSTLTNLNTNLIRHYTANNEDNNRDWIVNDSLNFTVGVSKSTDRFGTIGGAYEINTKQQVIRLATTGNFPLSGPSTISFWYFYNGNASADNVLLGSNSTSGNIHPLLLVNGTGLLTAWSNTGTATGNTKQLFLGQWHHIVLIRNGGNYTLFVNDTLVSNGTNLSLASFDRLGNNRPGFETAGALGRFDEIRIYNTTLNAQQVSALYNGAQLRSFTDVQSNNCAGISRNYQALFSSPIQTYQWLSNTQAVGTNAASYTRTLLTTDTAIGVQITDINNCNIQSYTRSIRINSADTVALNRTVCGSFTLGNRQLTVTGNYADTFTNRFGCDSIVRLNLTVNNSSAPNLTQGLIHYWPLNANEPRANYGGGTIELNYVGSVQITNNRTNQASAAYQFATGTNRAIVLENPISISNRTIAFWYQRQANTQSILLANQNSSILSMGFDGTVTLFGQFTSLPGVLVQNQWQHIVITNNIVTNTSSLYVNGQLILATSGVSSSLSHVANLASLNASATGAYDDIMIFDRVFTAGQIDSLRTIPTLVNTTVPALLNTACTSILSSGLTDGQASVMEWYRNNQLLGIDTFTTYANPVLADTNITIRIFKNCMRADYTRRIRVTRLNDTIRTDVCGSYTFNNKTYTTSGVYLDTLRHFSGCETYLAIYVNVNDTNATRVSRNGLIRYWNANAASIGKDVVNDDTLTFIGTGIGYGISRTLATNGAISITGTNSVIRTNIPTLNVGSISFYYFHVASLTTKVLLGSNATSLPAGHPLLVVVNNNLNVWKNTGNGEPTVALANNSWNHIVLVRNGGNYKLYVNNVLVNSGTDLSPANFDRLGNNRPGFETQGAAGGLVDDIFIYNRELNETEISTLNNERPMLNINKPLAACVGSSITVSTQFQFAGGWKYSVWRGNTKLSDTSFATIPSATLADTSAIVIRSFSNCRTAEYPIRLNITDQIADLNQGLLAFWTMKNTENRNSLSNGASPYSLAGTIGSNGALGRNNLDSNGALQITDKNNQWINTDLTTTALQNGQPFTVSFWFNSTFTNQGAEEGILLSNSNVSSVALLQLSTANQLQILNNAGQPIYSSASIPAGVWQHIIYANNGNGYYKLIVNGRLAAEGWGAIPALRPDRIGNGRPGLTNRGARGRYDDIMIYNRVVSNTEALAIYHLPAVINTPLSTSTCNNNATTFTWVVEDSTTVAYTFYKNSSTSFANTTSLNFTVAPNDTTVGLQIDKACATIRLTSKITKNTINLNNGLERFWTMNAKDAEKTLAAPTIGGAVKFTRSEPSNMPYTNGRLGAGESAVTLNTKSPYINMGIGSLTNITVSFWHRPNVTLSAEGVRALLGSNTSSVLNIDVSTGNLNMRALGTSGSYIGSSYTLTASVWQHIVFIRNGNDYQIYVNDTLRLSGTGINQAFVQYIGNSANFTFGALGLYDDIAVYNRAVSRDEVSALFRLPTITSIPDTAVLCAGASRNFAFAFANSNAASYELVKSNAPTFTQTTVLNANGTSGTTTAAAGDRIAVIQSLGCAQMQYNFYPTVQGTSGAGPALNYNPNTRNITVSTNFNQVRLFRNGTLLFTNTSNGNLNYTSPFRCGAYYAEYITTGSSCPSVSPTINALPIDTFNRNAALCTGRTIAFGSLNITAPGTYLQTFSGVVGNCDSTVRLTVTGAVPTSATISRIGCGSVTVLGNTYTQSGVYTATITNAAGCDSVITIQVTINAGGPSIRTFNEVGCYSYTLNNKVYTASGTYRDTLVGASVTGCDSILVLNLTLNVNRVILAPQNVCKAYVFNNKVITSSGTYSDTLLNRFGCDSIITVSVTIRTVDKTVTRSGNTLTATGSNNSAYQWINCTTNTAIVGATSASYTAIAAGTYAVILTSTNGCVDTSNCISVSLAPCNMNVTATVLGAGTAANSRQARIEVANATLPINYRISWVGNPTGISLDKSDSVHIYDNLLRESYKVVVTDANGCTDSVSFAIVPVGLAVSDVLEAIAVYPNPTRSNTQITGLPLGAEVSIYTMTGQRMGTYKAVGDQLSLAVNDWQSGMYLIYISHEGATKTTRLVIHRD